MSKNYPNQSTSALQLTPTRELLQAQRQTYPQCAAKTITEAQLVQSAQDLSDTTLENIAVLLTQRQAVAQKMLANPYDDDGMYEIQSNTMDYINDELRKLLAL